MQPAIVCLVADSSGDRPLPDLIREAVDAGVDLIQIRDRTLSGRTLADVTRRAAGDVYGTPTRIVVNDRLDVALAAAASGVHLTSRTFTADRARALAPPGFLIGRSVHDVAEATAAGGCDYLIFGTVFPSSSKPGRRASGLDALRQVCASVSIPVLAIGGIGVENAREVAAAGAAGIAAISLFRGEESMRALVTRLRQRFDT